LLENFSKNLRIWVYDKHRRTSYRTTVLKAGLKKDFLSPIADNVITDIEYECYPIIERIIDKKCVVCRLFTEPEQENNLFNLYRYIGCQITRTPNWREYLSTLKQEKLLTNETDLKTLQNHYFTHKQV